MYFSKPYFWGKGRCLVDPQHMCKILGVLVHAYNPSTGEAETRISVEIAGSAVWPTGESQIPVRDSV